MAGFTARINLDLARDDDDRRLFATARIQAERAHAARHDEADVAVAQFVRTNGFDRGLHHLRVRQRDVQKNRLGRIKQAVNVFLELENTAVVGADAFKNAVAIKQTVVEHGHLGVAFAAKFSINKNLHANGGQTTLKNQVKQT